MAMTPEDLAAFIDMTQSDPQMRKEGLAASRKAAKETYKDIFGKFAEDISSAVSQPAISPTEATKPLAEAAAAQEEKALMPAAEAAASSVAGKAMIPAALKNVVKQGAKLGGKAILGYGMVDSLYGDLADPSELPETQIAPGVTARGPDVMPFKQQFAPGELEALSGPNKSELPEYAQKPESYEPPAPKAAPAPKASDQEYANLLTHYKNLLPNGGSFLGGSAESRAKSDLETLQLLRSTPSEQLSNLTSAKLAQLEELANPVDFYAKKAPAPSNRAVAAAPAAKMEAAADKPAAPAPDAAAPVPKKQDSYEDKLARYLDNTFEIESGRRTNTKHATITDPDSMHYGTMAGGGYGIMPKTAQDIISKNPDLKEKYGRFLSIPSDSPEKLNEISDALTNDQEMDEALARAYANSILKQFDGDETRANYAWQYGPSGAEKASLDKILGADRTAKYAKLSGNTPFVGPYKPQYVAQKMLDKQQGNALAQNSSNKEPASVEIAPGEFTRQPASDVASLVNSIYGKDLSDDALKSAQQDASSRRMLANILSASEDIGHAISRSNQPLDKTFYNNMLKQADQPVENIKERRKAKDQEIGRKADLMKLKDAEDDRNPDSEASEQLRKIWSSVVPNVRTIPGFDKLSAHDLIRSQNVIELHEKAANALETAKVKATQKASEQEKKALSQFTAMVHASRSQNASVQQAHRDIRAASKAMHLFDMYPDLNKVPVKLKNLLVEEIIKLASGKAPTKEEFKELNDPTIKEKMQSFFSKWGNKPTPAQVGPFLEDFKKYVEILGKDSAEVINSNIRSIADLNQPVLGSQYERARDFKDPETKRFVSQEGAESGHGLTQEEINAGAKKHGLTPEEAAALAKLRAGK